MDRPIPFRRRFQGLLVAAVAAWAMLALPVLGPALLGAVRDLVLFPEDRFSGLRIWWGGLVVYGGFGLPVALAVTLAAELPAWSLLERRGLRSRRAALLAGAAAGGALRLGVAGLVLLGNLAEGGFRLGPPPEAGMAVDQPPILLILALWGLYALWMAACGALAGWVAWRVTTRGGSAPG